MKKILIASILSLTVACSNSDHPNEVVLQDGADGQPCIPEQTEGGINWSCPTGNYFFPVAQPGAQEPQNPTDGECSFKITEGTFIVSCPNQPPIIRPVEDLFAQGPKGDKGDKGESGDKVKVWEDADGCLWISVNDGPAFKIRHPL